MSRLDTFLFIAPRWTTGADGYTRFDADAFAADNLARLVVEDDDDRFDGYIGFDATQTGTLTDAAGGTLASGAVSPYFRYTATTESGTSFTFDMIVMPSGVVGYLPSRLPDPGEGFKITGWTLVPGSGATYDSVPRFPCFAPGSLIETAAGWRAVEALAPGDLIRTRDAGFQPVLWTGSARVPWTATSGQRPVRLLDHPALTGHLTRPLTLSALHRVLLSGPDLMLCTSLDEAFGAAAGLVPQMAGGSGEAVWHHVLLPGHHVIRANGIWVESLLAAPRALSWLPPDEAALVHRLGWRAGAPPVPCRPCLSLSETRAVCGTGPLRRAA